MIDPVVENLILDLLEWIGEGRPYQDVLDAWRTSCPRLPVWEDANDRGLVATERMDGRYVVKVTTPGRTLLAHRRPPKQMAQAQTKP